MFPVSGHWRGICRYMYGISIISYGCDSLQTDQRFYVDLCYDINYDQADKQPGHIKSLLLDCFLTDQTHCSWKYGVVVEKKPNNE